MTRLFAVLLVVTAWLDGYAQSSLPPCPGDTSSVWTNCFGSYSYLDGSKYVGEWKDDNRSGRGSYTLSSGDKYVGSFRNNARHGEGIQYNKDGSVSESGVWFYDQISKSFALDSRRFPFDGFGRTQMTKQRSPADKSNRTGVDLVKECLRKGLKPGTRQFSACVAGQ